MRHTSLFTALILASTMVLGCGDDDNPPSETGGAAGSTGGSTQDTGGSGGTEAGGTTPAGGTNAGGTAPDVDAGSLGPDAGSPCSDNGPCDELTECTVVGSLAVCGIACAQRSGSF